jgi:3-oxoacyl-[acyl-carrier-protein] synthase III
MQDVSLIGTASYLPEKIIDNGFFENISSNRMFAGIARRRHIEKDMTATSMIEKAAIKLVKKYNLDPKKDIDIILTNVTLPDEAFTGCGGIVSYRIGAHPTVILDLHNTGCVSFIYMMYLARILIRSGQGRSALVCNVQNSAGLIFSQSEVRKKPQSAVPGDGCGIGYLTASSENPIISIEHQCYGEYSADMFSTSVGRRYWEPGESQAYIDFTKEKIFSITKRGNEIVPRIIKKACDKINLPTRNINALITNQPNIIFLRNWREAIELSAEKHFDTFSEYGNLFGAAIPITFDEAAAAGKFHAGDHIVLAGFSHAGDYCAAAIVHCRQNFI